MEIRHHDPGYYNITWGGQGQLPEPLDIMREYHMIQAGNYGGRHRRSEREARPANQRLNGRLGRIAGTLETVTPQIDALQ